VDGVSLGEMGSEAMVTQFCVGFGGGPWKRSNARKTVEADRCRSTHWSAELRSPGGSPSLRPDSDNGYVASIFYLPSGLHDTQYGQRTKPE
jgi:hypothetical protein